MPYLIIIFEQFGWALGCHWNPIISIKNIVTSETWEQNRKSIFTTFAKHLSKTSVVILTQLFVFKNRFGASVSVSSVKSFCSLTNTPLFFLNVLSWCWFTMYSVKKPKAMGAIPSMVEEFFRWSDVGFASLSKSPWLIIIINSLHIIFCQF